jgi:hypothetical protein
MLLFRSSIISLEPNKIITARKKEFDDVITRIIPFCSFLYQEQLILAVTAIGEVMLIKICDLEVVFRAKAADGMIYDVKKTSRLNEYAFYSHESGMIFATFISIK